MKLKTLDEIQFSDIHNAFTKGFIDYGLPPMSIDQLNQMLTRRGFNPSLSIGAFADDELVSFTLNGIGQWQNKSTAYDTGTATIKAYRGQGLARKIFHETESVLKKAGISHYLLEVMQHNDKAVNLYKSMGFDVTREFDYSVSELKDLKFNSTPKSKVQITRIDLPAESLVDHFWDSKPSWQNTFDAIQRSPQNFTAYGAYLQNSLIGYAITELDSGDITQLAVHEKFRRQGVATELLKRIAEVLSGNSIKVINVESSNVIMMSFLRSIGMERSGQQFEMIKNL